MTCGACVAPPDGVRVVVGVSWLQSFYSDGVMTCCCILCHEIVLSSLIGRSSWVQEIATVLAIHKALRRFAMTCFDRACSRCSGGYYRDDEFLKQKGNKIRGLRLAKGLTQMDLAFACNDKDYSQINRIELGKVNFSVSYLSLIARALGVSPQDLLP